MEHCATNALKKTSQKESDTVIFPLEKKDKMRSKIVRKALEKIDPTTPKNRPKNVLKMVPGVSPGPPRGLHGASLRPAEAILENMQRDTKKQEKQQGSPDPIFQEKKNKNKQK